MYFSVFVLVFTLHEIYQTNAIFEIRYELSEEQRSAFNKLHSYNPSKDGDDPSPPRKCQLSFSVDLEKPVEFISPDLSKTENYPEKFSCSLQFMGNLKCSPSLTCKPANTKPTTMITETETNVCNKEFLIVSDGFGSEAKLCPSSKVTNLVGNQPGRDLYIEYEKNGQDKGFGFNCKVTCNETKKSNSLTENELVLTPKIKDSKRTILRNCICGHAVYNERIVGGKDASQNEFPWLAALVIKGERTPFCAASLINDRWLVTASHCFVNLNFTEVDYDVLLNAYVLDATVLGNQDSEAQFGQRGWYKSSGWDMVKFTDEMENSKRFKIKQVILHPLYRTNYDYDVALLEIDGNVDFTDSSSPTPICIPFSPDFDERFDNDTVVVAGWGKTHEKAASTTRKLQKLEGLTLVNNTFCDSKLAKYKTTERMFCAWFGEEKRDACQGDSGGPAMKLDSDGRFRQLGVVSFGEGCARSRRAGVYTRLSELVQWIRYQSGQNKNTKWCRDSKGGLEELGRSLVQGRTIQNSTQTQDKKRSVKSSLAIAHKNFTEHY